MNTGGRSNGSGGNDSGNGGGVGNGDGSGHLAVELALTFGSWMMKLLYCLCWAVLYCTVLRGTLLHCPYYTVLCCLCLSLIYVGDAGDLCSW